MISKVDAVANHAIRFDTLARRSRRRRGPFCRPRIPSSGRFNCHAISPGSRMLLSMRSTITAIIAPAARPRTSDIKRISPRRSGIRRRGDGSRLDQLASVTCHLKIDRELLNAIGQQLVQIALHFLALGCADVLSVIASRRCDEFLAHLPVFAWPARIGFRPPRPQAWLAR